jgi:hypothetical protein
VSEPLGYAGFDAPKEKLPAFRFVLVFIFPPFDLKNCFQYKHLFFRAFVAVTSLQIRFGFHDLSPFGPSQSTSYANRQRTEQPQPENARSHCAE